MRRTNGILPLTLAVVLGGCYTYAPMRVEDVPAGTTIRARVSPEQAARLREILGREDRELEGLFIGEAAGGNVTMSIPVAVRYAGLSSQWMRQSIEIPPQDLIEVEIRQIDKWKTGGVIAAGAATVGFVIIKAFVEKDSAEDKGDGKDGDDFHFAIPIRIPW